MRGLGVVGGGGGRIRAVEFERKKIHAKRKPKGKNHAERSSSMVIQVPIKNKALCTPPPHK